jgi:peptidoglycan hydrolase CwlO-like protein
MKWENFSNAEIRLKMNSMEMEYESIKNDINKLISKLDEIDKEYNKANEELKKRSKL